MQILPALNMSFSKISTLFVLLLSLLEVKHSIGRSEIDANFQFFFCLVSFLTLFFNNFLSSKLRFRKNFLQLLVLAEVTWNEYSFSLKSLMREVFRVSCILFLTFLVTLGFQFLESARQYFTYFYFLRSIANICEHRALVVERVVVLELHSFVQRNLSKNLFQAWLKSLFRRVFLVSLELS